MNTMMAVYEPKTTPEMDPPQEPTEGTDPTTTLILNVPASRTVRQYISIVETSSLWCFVVKRPGKLIPFSIVTSTVLNNVLEILILSSF